MENPNDYIIIPNPIYDVVFKYLMEDEESAKIILSTLINENIKHLVFEPPFAHRKSQRKQRRKGNSTFSFGLHRNYRKTRWKRRTHYDRIAKSKRNKRYFSL